MKQATIGARFALLASMSTAMLSSPLAARAGITDISQTPMASSSSTVVKPNLMFVLDDSLSMSWTHLPDNVADFGVGSEKYGYRSSHCNGVYYNPNITYVPPPKGTSAGGNYSNADFTKAWKNGFNTAAGTVDLRTKFYSFGDGNDGTDNTIAAARASDNTAMQSHDRLQAAYYYVYSGSQTSDDAKVYEDATGNYFYKECNTTIGSSSQVNGVTVSSVFTKVLVSATSGPGGTDERQNFANWFSYYRTRMLMMKSAVGRAFKNIDDRYRIGYSTINYAGVDSTDDRFLNIADFGATQKESFYTKLYKATFAITGTPLRPALAKAGRIFAGKLLTGDNDPVQYSCQQNFTLLSTDGYWNNNAESSSYGAFKVDGVQKVGNEDGGLEKPYYDGSKITVTSKTTYATVVRKQTVTPKTITTPWLRTVRTVTNTACTVNRRAGLIVNTQSQIYNQVARQTSTSVDDVRSTTDRTTVTVNGSLTQDTSVAGADTTTHISTTTKTDSDSGAPVGSTVWANSGGVSSACESNPGSSSTSSGVAQSNSTVDGTPAVTVLSTTGPTAGTPVVVEKKYEPSTTLADIAAYYYNTDLRTSNCTVHNRDVCENNVTGGGADNAVHQHMTTFTLGLGINGKLKFREGYLQGESPDYEALKQGTVNWPDPTIEEGPERVDDLWHAAVNGHGTYFSAQTPDSLVSGISKALAGVSVRPGSGAAAATSNLEPVKSDNLLFLALYRTVVWDGDLQMKTIDPNTGEISKTVKWSARDKLDAQAGLSSDARTIYIFDSTGTNKLKSFTWGNLNAAETAYFTGICSASLLSQCVDTVLGPNLTSAQKDMISGQNLVNFIRGQSGFEDQEGNSNRIYRDREHVLGDMVSSQPVYVKAPTFAYADAGYADFRTVQKDRAAMVYVAANDGMLHAFDATMDLTDSGTEKWAYIPPMVMPNLYRLADRNYATNHQYYVDGAPTVGDICPKTPAAACAGNEWKTILV
jgi:type IV pilus assembly protein PilY1